VRVEREVCARREFLDQHGQTPAVMRDQPVKPVTRIKAEIQDVRARSPW
jgi:hypothetical protein